ncbi:MAG: hypothetical protein K6T88_06725 [Bacillus sp. (in: Bacteria)]|nr:hypothetical protein [Bacillus sp. (in: firmicutes)]
MQSSVLDTKLYKKIEDDFNRQLLTQANSLSFIRMVGAAIEEHLNQLVALKELSEQWLNLMDLPTRDDIADIAEKVIKNEDRLDNLDDMLYQTLEEIKNNRNQMARVAWKLAEISAEFDTYKVIEMVGK